MLKIGNLYFLSQSGRPGGVNSFKSRSPSSPRIVWGCFVAHLRPIRGSGVDSNCVLNETQNEDIDDIFRNDYLNKIRLIKDPNGLFLPRHKTWRIRQGLRKGSGSQRRIVPGNLWRSLHSGGNLWG